MMPPPPTGGMMMPPPPTGGMMGPPPTGPQPPGMGMAQVPSPVTVSSNHASSSAQQLCELHRGRVGRGAPVEQHGYMRSATTTHRSPPYVHPVTRARPPPKPGLGSEASASRGAAQGAPGSGGSSLARPVFQDQQQGSYGQGSYASPEAVMGQFAALTMGSGMGQATDVGVNPAEFPRPGASPTVPPIMEGNCDSQVTIIFLFYLILRGGEPSGVPPSGCLSHSASHHGGPLRLTGNDFTFGRVWVSPGVEQARESGT
jgi:hypothetical protein